MIKRKLLLGFICLAIAFFALNLELPRADAASSGEIQDHINELEEEQKALKEQMEALESQLIENAELVGEMVLQKQTIEQQVTLLYNQIRSINEQIIAHNLLIADKQLELEEAEARLSELNQKYKERIRTMEEEGALSYWEILFESRNFFDFLDRLNMAQEIAKSDERRLDELHNAAKEVAQVSAVLASQKEVLEDTKRELETSENLLNEKMEESNLLMQALLAKGEEYEKLLAEAEAEDEKLMDEIAKLEDDYDEALYQEYMATYVPPTTKPKEEIPPVCESGWMTPVANYRLSSPFGMRMHPVLGYKRMHSGVDMACPAGTPIYAARGGKVTIAKKSSSAGNYVQINHGDGYSSVYMHMTRYVVAVGDYVAQGQLIGYVGNTGISNGNHLHFGISYKGTYVNPMEFVD